MNSLKIRKLYEIASQKYKFSETFFATFLKSEPKIVADFENILLKEYESFADLIVPQIKESKRLSFENSKKKMHKKKKH